VIPSLVACHRFLAWLLATSWLFFTAPLLPGAARLLIQFFWHFGVVVLLWCIDALVVFLAMYLLLFISAIE
jgi:hypothetical protein